MTYRGSLVRTGLFAVAYLIAVWAGRLTVMDDINLSMVWPAAGIAAVWFCAQREAPARWADVAALAVITLIVNTATGATAALALVFVARGVTPALTVTAARDGEMVLVCVADNGIGIPEGQHDEIFGDFHRAHSTLGYAGTGLGLGICRRIVERHGGTITAADNPGGGSRFEFSVPAAGPDRQPVRDSAQLR